MKYELTSETIEHNNRTLYRIRALKDFNDVKNGDLGGYVQSLKNLSQYGDSWIYDDALVYGNAHVFEKAQVFGNAEVYGNAHVFNHARVFGNALVFGNAKVCGNAKVSGNALVYGNADVYEKAQVFGNAKVFENAHISGNARVSKTPTIITGLKYKIQLFDNLIAIGCQLKTKEEWLKLTNEEINELDGKQTFDLINQIKKTIELYG